MHFWQELRERPSTCDLPHTSYVSLFMLPHQASHTTESLRSASVFIFIFIYINELLLYQMTRSGLNTKVASEHSLTFLDMALRLPLFPLVRADIYSWIHCFSWNASFGSSLCFTRELGQVQRSPFLNWWSSVSSPFLPPGLCQLQLLCVVLTESIVFIVLRWLKCACFIVISNLQLPGMYYNRLLLITGHTCISNWRARRVSVTCGQLLAWKRSVRVALTWRSLLF